MKYRIYRVLLICLMIFSLSSCNTNYDTDTIDTPTEKAYFEATVLKKADNAILVEPSKMTSERKSSDLILININNKIEEKSLEVLDDLEVGDTVTIGYSGEILESYPAQINEVYEITLVEKGENIEKDHPSMVIVNGKLYKATGKESDIVGRCGVMDGESITSVGEAEIPTEEGQSNFGTGYGYQYVGEGSIDVLMPDGKGESKWMRFVTEMPDLPVATATTASTETLTLIDTLEGVSMEVVYVNNQGIKLSFLNKTDKDIQFGDDYSLEMKKDGKWYAVDYIIENFGFHSIAYVAQKDVLANWEVDWTYFHGILPRGTYRIVKSVADFKGTGDFSTYNLAAEFVVE